MKQITISELRRNPWSEIQKELPLELLVDNEVAAVIASTNDFMYIGNLHIRVKNMIKALVARATQAEPKGRVSHETAAEATT